jgi:hypothetical protein
MEMFDTAIPLPFKVQAYSTSAWVLCLDWQHMVAHKKN